MDILVVGFDSAWTFGKSGALAGIIRKSDGSLYEFGPPQKATYSEAQDIILKWQASSSPSATVVMLDQPTIVKNPTGQRPVENIVGAPVSLRRGGVQPANTSKDSMFGPNAPIWPFLERFGGPADPLAPLLATQVYETYPVLSMISLGWTLPDARPTGRLPKYNPDRRKTFSMSDWKYLCDQVVEITGNIGMKEIHEWVKNAGLITKPDKRIQDGLDACICLLIGLHFVNGGRCLIVGDPQTGYMVVPAGNDLQVELETRCSLSGRDPKQWVQSFECRAFENTDILGQKVPKKNGISKEFLKTPDEKIKKEYQDKIDAILREAYIQAAEIEAEAELEDSELQGQMGFCHLFWSTKKRILKEKYGIDWKSPAKNNPHALFD